MVSSLVWAAAGQTAPEPRKETVVVTGTYEPLSIEELDRAVTVLPVRDFDLTASSISDFLRLDPSLDLRARAPGGIQGDLSIRGASYGSTLILLNGLRIADAQSAHHNLDFPVPMDAVSRIEVLRGAGSTMYGSDAIGGVVNIITEAPEYSEVRLRAGVGNFGMNQQSGSLALVQGKLSEMLTFSRDFSTGFRPDRDYRNLTFGSATHVGKTSVDLGYSDRPFGADQFYGNYNSWENTKTWFAGVRQAIDDKTTAAVAYRRHSDLFVLYRDRPEVFTNHHADDTVQASLRRHDKHFSYGAEFFHDRITSNNLGQHERSRGAVYAAYDIRAAGRFSFEIGAREEVYRSWSGQFSPTAAAGVWLTSRLKLRASVSRAFRVPSYTDLYYHDPANVGSPDLRPERAWSYEGGADWRWFSATVFHRRERDVIDFVRSSPADIWRATNFQRLNYTGVELSARLPRNVTLSYTGLHGVQDVLNGIQSKYSFNYPVHQGLISWFANTHGVLFRTRVGVLSRFARDPYVLWDGSAAYTKHWIRPYVQLANLTGTSYEEIPGVVMPGRSVIGGVEFAFTTRKR